MNAISFILLIIGIFLLGIIIGFVLYLISPKKENISSFCNTNDVYGKFDDYEISIDVAVKDFKLFDL